MSRYTGQIESVSNNIVLNYNQTASLDYSAITIQRWQKDNDSGLGDVVNGIEDATGTFATANTFPVSFTTGGTVSTTDNYYNGWWLRITNDTPAGILDEVRQITAYVGTTRTFTVSSSWTAGSPTASTTFNLYQSSYISAYWDEVNDKFVVGGIPRVTDTTISSPQYVNLKVNNLVADTVNIGINTTLPGYNYTAIGGKSDTMTLGTSSVTYNHAIIRDLPLNGVTSTTATSTITATELAGGFIVLTNGNSYTLDTTANLATEFGIVANTFSNATNRVIFRVRMSLSGGFSQSASVNLGTGQQWTNKTASSTVTITGGAELVFKFTSTTAMTITVLP